MTEQTVHLNLTVLLPGIQNDQDGCVGRLESAIQNHKGVLRAHINRDQQPAVLCLHYDPNLVTIESVMRMARQAGARIVNRFHHQVIEVEGMDCADCAVVVQHGISRMDGVLSASLSYPLKTLQIEYDAQKISRAAIEKRIHAFGYSTPPSPLIGWYSENREVLFSLLAGLLLLAGWLGETFFGLPRAAAITMYVLAYIIGGWEIAQHAWGSLKARQFDTDLLMVVAALGAAALGNLSEGALLIFLFSLGHALEERALEKARSAIRGLQDLAPAVALVRQDGVEREAPVEELRVGEIVIVRPGVRIPADGQVTSGVSMVNQAPVTGESIPVEKQPDSQVFAGTVNGEGSLEVRVTRAASDSTLARVMKMVEEAQAHKSPTQQTVEHFTAVFVPAVLALTVLVIAIPPLFGVPFQDSFLRGMTLLVAASPCALALGAPSAILSGVAQAARNGVLVKGGVHLENLGRVNAIAFDKTGTITHGQPEVTDIIPTNGATADELLTLAARVENRSAHPLAAAITRRAQSIPLPANGVTDVEAVTGKGIRAQVDGQPVWVGSQKLMEEANIPISDADRLAIRALQEQGKTIILVGAASGLVGALGLADTVRPTSTQAIAQIKRLGVQSVALLTGDHPAVAKIIADQSGITQIFADLLPEDKLKIVREMISQYGQVAMVGDGVNDAPALAHATVGIAMGGAGTDIALETADVALMGGDLSRLPFAIGIGRATRRIIIQNLWISLGVIALLAGASVIGLAGIGIAIIIHEGSTLLVVLNSLRLLVYQE